MPASLGSHRCWTLLVSNKFCTIRLEERCTAVLFGTTLVMAAYAPDSNQDMGVCEASLWSVLGVPREAEPEISTVQEISTGNWNGVYRRRRHREAPRDEMYGPTCWQGYDHDPRGIKKLMWYGIMKEFNCKATSTWSKCGLAKEAAFTH